MDLSNRVNFWPLGKVHGSLARAGKVRGQTPKVRTSMTIKLLFNLLIVFVDYMFVHIQSVHVF